MKALENIIMDYTNEKIHVNSVLNSIQITYTITV